MTGTVYTNFVGTQNRRQYAMTQDEVGSAIGSLTLGYVTSAVLTATLANYATNATLANYPQLSQVWTNTRNAKTTAYTLAPSDSGDTVALGGSGFYTLTANAPSAYPSAFLCTVLNEDTVRAKRVALSGGQSFYLYPEQSAVVYTQNNTWQFLKNNRWQLPGTTALQNLYKWFVDGSLGNDANDGLATGSGAKKTIQAAVDDLADFVDANQQGIMVSVADASAQTATLNLKTVLGVNNFWPGIGGVLPLVIRGNLGAPVVWNSGTNVTMDALAVKGWRVDGFAFTNSGSAVWESEVGGHIYVGANTYNGTNGTAIFEAVYNGRIEVVDAQIVNSTAMSFFCYSFFNGLVIFTGNTITINPTIAFADFMVCDALGIILAAGNTYNGAGASLSTGNTFSVTNGGYLSTGGHFTLTGGGANLVGNVYAPTTTGYVV